MPQWAMSIDLDRCTGCEACMLACSSENNIPTAGPEQSAMGRSKQWIRIDRYYEGEFPNIKVKYRPVLCQHCDDAPCEPVCPVFATYQNAEGLNVQVYNRCIGTRYCANNCPYTVRFFNWFAPEWDGPLDLQLQPGCLHPPGGSRGEMHILRALRSSARNSTPTRRTGNSRTETCNRLASSLVRPRRWSSAI